MPNNTIVGGGGVGVTRRQLQEADQRPPAPATTTTHAEPQPSTTVQGIEADAGTKKVVAHEQSLTPIGAGGRPSGSLSPLSARMAQVVPERAPLDPKALLDDARARLDVLARRAKADPTKMGALRDEAQRILQAIEPALPAQESALAALETKLAKEEGTLGWFQKNVGAFSPDHVKALRQEIESLSSWIGDAKAFCSGARIALRAGADADLEASPETWRTRLDEAAARVTAAPTEQSVAALVKLQDSLGGAADASRVQSAAAGDDVKSFGSEVAWHQKWKWLDVVIGGESERGALYRTGKREQGEAAATASGFGDVQQAGERAATGAINTLLKKESPDYAALRARYDLLKPAYDDLREALGAARDAAGALDDAERWVARRDVLAGQKPWNQYETVKDPQTCASRQEETAAYRSWRNDYENAQNQAQWSLRSAESDVGELNAKLPSLERSLRALGEYSPQLARVDDNLMTWFSTGFSFGPFSIEGMNVDGAQRDLRDVEGRLHQLFGRIEPDYEKHLREVTARISARRDELRASAD